VLLDDGTVIDEGQYKAENLAIIHELPVLPGAALASTESSPYFDGDSAGAPVSGFTTHAKYRVPEGTTDEAVVEFYLESMPADWEGCRDSHPAIEATERGQPTNTPYAYILFARFGRGTSVVHVDTTTISAVGYEGYYTVTVDQLSDHEACPETPAAG
jgi:hypothetical protein